jgi:hypothetical protein
MINRMAHVLYSAVIGTTEVNSIIKGWFVFAVISSTPITE